MPMSMPCLGHLNDLQLYWSRGRKKESQVQTMNTEVVLLTVYCHFYTMTHCCDSMKDSVYSIKSVVPVLHQYSVCTCLVYIVCYQQYILLTAWD